MGFNSLTPRILIRVAPTRNRTVVAFFNCDDVVVTDRKQTIYEEGGKTRGLVAYVYDGKAHVGEWNRAEYIGPVIDLRLKSNLKSGITWG